MNPSRRNRSFSIICTILLAVIVLIPTVAAQPATPTTGNAPVPIDFPRDDGPHSAAIEWWYYTGHMFTDSGDRYGFEFVVFKGETSGLVGYASHFAITDSAKGTFQYDERLVPGEPTVASEGFDLAVGDWQMSGANGNDRLVANLDGYEMNVDLTSEKPAVLHEGDGYIEYGNGESSYYYSRTRMPLTGELTVDGESLTVTGEAWMDHQWGNFTTFATGWDWYALQLDDGSDLMLYIIRDEDGTPAIVDGTLVAADGTATFYEQDDFTVTPTGEWTSPHSGATYPMGWEITVPSAELALTVDPTLLDQELDTTATTGVIYWEGEVSVSGERAGTAVSGFGYVELTGYVPVGATPFDQPNEP